MSEPKIHFLNLIDCFEEAKRKIEQIQKDGHFSDDTILQGITHIMQIIDGLRKRIDKRTEDFEGLLRRQKEKENKNGKS